MPFYAVAYAHVVRYEKASTVTEAAWNAFGVKYDSRMTVVSLQKNPKYTSNRDKDSTLKRLAVAHFRKTGHVLAGYEETPGIKNVHRTVCYQCGKHILTEPASKGVDGVPCVECQQKGTA